MLNFTAVSPGGVKPFDYAGIKRDRPDQWGELCGKTGTGSHCFRYQGVSSLIRFIAIPRPERHPGQRVKG
jgi:hypothetical protein